MANLVAIKGYKLPRERVWVTTTDMYEVYSKIDLIIDGEQSKEFIITDITDEGLFIDTIH